MVYVLMADGFEEAEAIVPIDILMRGGVKVKTLSVTGKTEVVGTHGIKMQADGILGDSLPDAEMLVFPGGMPGAQTLCDDKRITPLCDAVLKNGGRLAAICAAPMVLGVRGYLQGKKATCFPSFEPKLLGALPTGARVVTDGMITTAVGMGAAAEFGVELLRVLRGKDVAAATVTRALLPNEFLPR